ncbi:MAG: hypothetical protein ACJAT7_001361, partial [Psychromonas sp.]
MIKIAVCIIDASFLYHIALSYLFYIISLLFVV